MDAESYYNRVQGSAGQPLGGKEIHFPIAGLATKLGPSRLSGACTPACINVVLRYPYNEDATGGTRPGLKAFSGTQPTSKNVYHWMWPNGDLVQWPDGDIVSFATADTKVTMPDGSLLLNQHETFDVTAAKGAIPSGLTSVTMYRARMVVAKDTMWYASRTGEYDDFDYGGDVDDMSRAAAGNVALAGRSGDNITVLAPLRDSVLMVATKRSLWRFVGDVTNTMQLVSESIGVISPNAWCYDGMRFWFIGPNGLYAMGMEEVPTLMTSNLEDKFSGWTSATLIYDPERRGIHIIGQDGGDHVSDWYFDIANGAAWPILYPVAKRPIAGGTAMTANKNKVIFYCADNVFRYWDESQTTDDGTNIVSALAFGPVSHTTGSTENSFLAEIDCDFDSSVTTASGANVSGVVGNTALDVIGKTNTMMTWILSGSSTAPSEEKFRYAEGSGWNSVVRPRVRCNTFSLVVWNRSSRWAISRLTAVQRGCGRIRR